VQAGSDKNGLHANGDRVLSRERRNTWLKEMLFVGRSRRGTRKMGPSGLTEKRERYDLVRAGIQVVKQVRPRTHPEPDGVPDVESPAMRTYLWC
jgi:hypothetical protein